MVTLLICRDGGRKNDLFTADIPESYDGACEHLRSDTMRARKLFPDTDALLTGPQHASRMTPWGHDRISLALKEETEKRRRTF